MENNVIIEEKPKRHVYIVEVSCWNENDGDSFTLVKSEAFLSKQEAIKIKNERAVKILEEYNDYLENFHAVIPQNINEYERYSIEFDNLEDFYIEESCFHIDTGYESETIYVRELELK